MSWAKLGDEFYDQPATMEASLEAVGRSRTAPAT
jgi:hypothetical protein